MPVWREDQGANRVRVKKSRAGGLSLQIDGTFASWYEPGRVTTGSVWDGLVAPLLLLPPARRRSVLILGLGGGSAARLVRALVPRAEIVGVEYDAEVLDMARRNFGLDALGIEIVRADARGFLATEHRRFDFVIDDIFVGKGRGVRKPLWMLDEGVELAAKRVAQGGVLVSNTIDETRHVVPVLCRFFPATLCLRIDEYENRILAAGPTGATGVGLRRVLAAEPLFRRVLSALQIRTLPVRKR